MGRNVFASLSGPSRRAEENYLTEAFAFVLRLLLEREPGLGLALLGRLSGLPEGARPHDPRAVEVSTQVTDEAGRPDLVVRDGRRSLVYVEVKHDAPLGAGQLEYYLERLQASRYPHTRLVLLTRSRASARETTLARDEYHHVRWHEVHAWLAEGVPADEVCRYFAGDFVAFLKEKNMSMERVPKEYVRGVEALVDLTRMLEASIGEAMPDANYSKHSGWGWRGFAIAGGHFYGVRLDRPSLVVFEDNLGNAPTHERHLDLERGDFFSMEPGEQFERLVAFLREAGAARDE